MEKISDIKDARLVIVPDVHGREFWRQPVTDALVHTGAQIVFLGDYVDPYPFEWEGEPDVDYKAKAIEILKDIIGLKSKYKDRMTLLLGNHDCSYAYSTRVCNCRRDRKRADEIREIFRGNHKLFDIAYEQTINGKSFILSHAGILRGWLEDWGYPVGGNVNIVDYLNNLNQMSLGGENPADSEFCHALAQSDFWRGGDDDSGSVVWSDIRNVAQNRKRLYPEGLHIVGHTMTTGQPVVTDDIALIDCQKVFCIDGQGELKEFMLQ